MSPTRRIPPPGVAFLCSQVGVRAAQRFAELSAELGLTPPLAGMLRLIATEPGLSQQAIARRLGILPSRLVSYVDDLEAKGLLERRRNPEDRRRHVLHLSAEGERTLGRLAEISRAHESELTAPLNQAERKQLHALLQRVAEGYGLTPGIHPGYRTL